jgi:N-acetylglutamate synthase-like GNAT family acetyltransferase
VNVTTRLAMDTDAPAIKALLSQTHETDESIDFSHIAPFWLVAEIEGKIVGCIQTLPSRPFGGLENLHLSGALSRLRKAKVAEKLLLDGCAILRYHGASHVIGFVSDSLAEYRGFLERRRTKARDSGSQMIVRVV